MNNQSANTTSRTQLGDDRKNETVQRRCRSENRQSTA